MPVELQPNRIVFQSATGARRYFELGPHGADIDLSGAAVVIDNRLSPPPRRRIVKFSTSGVLLVEMRLATDAPVSIADDNASYTIADVRRTCPSPIVRVIGTDDGELVILRRGDAPDPARNLLRFDRDGRLRWQIAPRAFRPYDSIVDGAFLPNGNVRASAAPNGWSAELDDRTGAVVAIDAR
jgi:hypothetical protein